MTKLVNKSSNETLFNEVFEATNFKSRLIGLIGTKKLSEKAYYFPRCNWIHTFFMSIPIDVIYLDKKGFVKKIDHNLQPWRMPLPVMSAHSVIEMAAGEAKARNIKTGDELHVGN